MALGDLIGEVGNTYLNLGERVAKAGIKQNSFDATNYPSGPVGRASAQLTNLSQLPPDSAPALPPQPISLLAASPPGTPHSTPSNQAQPPLSNLAEIGSRIGAGLLNNPQSAAQKPSVLSDALQVGVQPVPGSPTYPTSSQQAAMAASAAQPPGPVAPAPLSLEQARPVVGGSDTSNARTSIVGSANPDGTASFSNQQSDLKKAYGQAPVSVPAVQSLADLANVESAAGSGPSFAALGSAKNLGDGIGAFSQANAGDAKVATDRFNRAADLRQGYAEQDALARARQQANIDNSFTTVRDSSKPLTRNDLAQAGLDQQARVNDQQAIKDAQEDINSGLAQRAATQQVRQAQSLDDLRVAAAAPNATDAQKSAYQGAIDPTGAKALERQLTQAQINEKNASAAKLQSEANPAGGPKLTEQQSKDAGFYLRANAANSALATQQADLTGGLDSVIRAIPKVGDSSASNLLVSDKRLSAEQSAREFITAILRKDSGAVIGPEEIDTYGKLYLPQPGDSEGLIKQKEEARTRALQGLQQGLGPAQLINPPVTNPDKVRAATQASANGTQAAGSAAVSAPIRVNSQAELQGLPSGTVFITPDGKTKRVP